MGADPPVAARAAGEEEANGVALTANPFDESQLEPSFYVNVQWGGEAEVVHPPPGISRGTDPSGRAGR